VGIGVANALWGGCNWGRGDVNINVNRYNNINTNRQINANSNRTNWNHNTEHRGRSRIILIGPRAQSVLARYLARGPEMYCFRPVDSEQKRRAEQHANRKTPINAGNVPGSNRKQQPKRPPMDRYNVDSYRRAIERACTKAKITR